MSTGIEPGNFALETELSRGDAAAFREIYNQYQLQVFRFAVYLTKSSDLAEELVQEVFTRVWEKREIFTNGIEILPYIKKMAFNLVLDNYRKAGREKILFQKILNNMKASLEDPLEPLHEKELNLIYQKAMENLPRQQRLVFMLSRDQNLTYQEIAARLEISPNTVRNHMSEALRSVRKHVREHADLPLVLTSLFLQEIF